MIPTTSTNIPEVLGKGFVDVISLLLIFIEVVYIFYAFLLSRQIKLMNSSFNTPIGTLFTFAGRIHFVASLIVAGISILILL